MPHLIHHKRRHSWPYCGSGMRPRERQNVPIITVTGPDDELDTQFLTPVVSEDLLEDDAASAGIVRSQPTHPHHRLWHSSKEGAGHSQTSIATVSLRKMVQPPLDRARSLFVLPSTITAKEVVFLPDWVHRLAAHPMNPTERGRPQEDRRGRLSTDKNHRRCHSERPRSWKQPSEKLWTLKEE
ncbi:uncharacterized protein BJX67DRAFT_261261 [Aspergillus lucknowensis]|uniref:Uncharacterized protein n=1 Tax=Aspergillus lucknowensis TaxID=176173 RepID=A0ABR4LG05_9EURO